MIKKSIIRMQLFFAICILLLIIIAIKIIDFSFSEESVKMTKENQIIQSKRRADILDRNNILIATDIKSFSVYANPKKIIDKEFAAKIISSAINIDYKILLNRLQSKKEFIWVVRNISPKNKQKIYNLGIPGIYFINDIKRFYPHGSLFSHIVGYTDLDNFGISGAEKLVNERLLENPDRSLNLSLDFRLQDIMRSELSASIIENDAESASGIILDVNTGEVLSLVSLPDFNPNLLSSAKPNQLFNRATSGVYEMGSVMKAITIASALDAGSIDINDYFNIAKSVQLGNFNVSDYSRKFEKQISVPEILIHSSNLGAVRVANEMGIKKQREYFQKFGIINNNSNAAKKTLEFADNDNVLCNTLEGQIAEREKIRNIPEVARTLHPKENSWDSVRSSTISYGHGIAITQIHLAQSFAAIVNGGFLVDPTIFIPKEGVSLQFQRILSEKTSIIMRKILYLVAKEGTARSANVPGYLVGGKTGTAEQIKQGRYDKNHNLSIVTVAFPMNEPKYLIIIALDAAKKNKANNMRVTGGAIAAPIASRVIKNITSVLSIKPKDFEPPSLYLKYTPRMKNLTFAKKK
ncbi:MAG: penicillin-binding protein 2 [Proteobacteria bacterium]|nr:penicillin-binding protein 2 [Pseudomonadota bacterium]